MHGLSWPAQPPDHDANAEPVPGVAVSVTDVPAAYASTQSAPHEIPVGVEVTVPAVPARAHALAIAASQLAVERATATVGELRRKLDRHPAALTLDVGPSPGTTGQEVEVQERLTP